MTAPRHGRESGGRRQRRRFPACDEQRAGVAWSCLPPPSLFEGTAMSSAESVKSVPGRPWPNGDPSTWVYLDDIPTPAEVPAIVEAVCRRYGFWRRRHRDEITQERKLMFLFPRK